MATVMSNQYLTIKLDNNKIELTNRISFTYDKTNLPKQAFGLKTHRPLFWKLEQKYYDPTTEVLTVFVVDYNLSVDTILLDFQPEYPIKKLNFEKLNWLKFEPLLYSYTLSQLKESIFNYRDKFLDLSSEKSEDFKFFGHTDPNIFFAKHEPVEHVKEIEMRVKYEEAKFYTSKIYFSINLKPYKLVKRLEIINNNLRPEFEYIKPYFVKRLGKSFLVKIRLKFLDNEIEEIIAQSDDINNINENLINSIKVSSVLELKHLKMERKDKVLYDTKELSAEAKNPFLLDLSAKDILEIFIENDKVKNVRQLEYLAKDKQALNERVQFTIKPLFGFVFHELDNKHYFIWELLNSHATYVWKSKNMENNLDLGKIVEQAIATIKNDGRVVYKKYYKAIENPSFDFCVIDHSSNNLTDDERFSEWRKKLERFCS